MTNWLSLHLSVAHRLRAAGCVYAEEEARLLIDSVPRDALHAKVERRASGVPLEYVLGWAEFCGHRVVVEEGVFIPRRRSEFLASLALGLLGPGDAALDLCCGSGALAVAMARRSGADAALSVWASDIDPVAVQCARRNLEPIGGHVVQGDVYASLPPSMKGRFRLIVANAPYVPSDETALLPREARLYEPRFTFDGGDDGLAVQRRVAAEAPAWLARRGSVLIETSQAAADGTRSILEERGFAVRMMRSDDWDATVAIGSLA